MISLKLDTTVAKVAKVEIIRDSSLLVSCESDSPLVAIKKALEKVGDDVAAGSAFHEALSRHPKVFTAIWLSMVEAGSKETDEQYDVICVPRS